MSEAPDPETVVIPPAVVEKLMSLEFAVAQATSVRDTYQAGLCAGLGIDPARVIGLDTAKGVLLLAPDDAA